MDFVFDYISDNTYWTVLLIIHGLLAVALLGALTHQAMSVLTPVRQVAEGAGFVTRFRTVPGGGYAAAVCVLWIVTLSSARGSTPSIAFTSAFRSSSRGSGRRRASSR